MKQIHPGPGDAWPILHRRVHPSRRPALGDPPAPAPAGDQLVLAHLQALGDVSGEPRVRIEVSDTAVGAARVEEARFAATFGAVSAGATLLYIDSSGHLALADNQGSLATRLRVATGARLRISSSDS